MKLPVILLSALLFVSCADRRPPDAAPDANKIARNKEVAVKNEVAGVTREAQKIEQFGRGMEVYRTAKNPESARECRVFLEDGQKQIMDLEARIKKLPDVYSVQLTPITSDLNECVSCAGEAKAGCVKARASVNNAIAEIYRQ